MYVVKWHEVINGKKQIIQRHVALEMDAKQLRNEKHSAGLDAWFEWE